MAIRSSYEVALRKGVTTALHCSMLQSVLTFYIDCNIQGFNEIQRMMLLEYTESSYAVSEEPLVISFA